MSLKFLLIIVHAVVVILIGGVVSLFSIKFFNLEPRLNLRRLNFAGIIIIGLSMIAWIFVAPLINITFNIYTSDLRRLIDRASPISTIHMPLVDSKLLPSDKYEIDFENSCGDLFNARSIVATGQGYEYSEEYKFFRLEGIYREDLDNDLTDETVLTYRCGANSSVLYGQIFARDMVFLFEVGPKRSRLEIKDGEISIIRQGGGPACCPTNEEFRYYHFRNGMLLEHRERKVRDI